MSRGRCALWAFRDVLLRRRGTLPRRRLVRSHAAPFRGEKGSRMAALRSDDPVNGVDSSTTLAQPLCSLCVPFRENGGRRKHEAKMGMFIHRHRRFTAFLPSSCLFVVQQ